MTRKETTCPSKSVVRMVLDKERKENWESIPRLYALRRIDPRYRHVLPVHIMKRYRCIVVGGKRGMLTVALAGKNSEHIITYLHQQTGCSIFPVSIEPERLRLLLQRAEWSEYNKESVKRNKPLLHPLLLHSLLPLLTFHTK